MSADSSLCACCCCLHLSAGQVEHLQSQPTQQHLPMASMPASAPGAMARFEVGRHLLEKSCPLVEPPAPSCAYADRLHDRLHAGYACVAVTF